MNSVTIRRSLYCPALIIVFLCSSPGRPQDGSARLAGFTAEHSRRQLEIEARFQAIPSPEEARKTHRFFTSAPHPAGSERNNELARHLEKLWSDQGWEDIRMHRYDVLASFPREVSLEMVSPVRYQAGLREDAYDVDPDTSHPDIRPAYLALSISGEVTAPVVYANSGNPEDYAVLRKHGVDVRGKIVLVRYSNPYSYRGFKAFTAEKMGAAGILIYSDPAEDGYGRGAVFPDGPWGPESHIQRGAITYDFLVAGDPLTPGWASVPGARQVPREQAVSLPKIMALPLSWRDAKPLLENMDGPVAPDSWQGGLKFKYRIGGRAVRAHMKVDMDTRIAPNYVVEARIRGSELPDEWILLGNHRDAWEFGGVDPSSGTASMVEVTRALGQLKKEGIRPRRTVVVCSWDGEEVGLTGSTEWGEQFADELKKKLVAYINVDSSTSGPTFEADSVASLAPLIVEVSRTLGHPEGKTLYDAWRRERAEAAKKPVPERELVDTRIGSGSDHTVFLNFLGRPTIGLAFTGPYGVYHSIYDNYYWINRFGDPGYRYHTLMARLWGVLALRLANADILPFDFDSYGHHLRQFTQQVERTGDAPAHLDFAGLYRGIDAFEAAGAALNRSAAAALAQGSVSPKILGGVNRAIMDVEGNWLHPDGIPGRPWFKHILYAARYTYAHLELPGLTEAVEKSDWETARSQARILERALDTNTRLLREAAGLLEEQAGGSRPDPRS
ncbi:MAG: M28 family peptidase [Acidobacteria bacterium]|nr:M28 family peptidase [Acidobacteriota bacterium]